MKARKREERGKDRKQGGSKAEDGRKGEKDMYKRPGRGLLRLRVPQSLLSLLLWGSSLLVLSRVL